MQLLNKELRDKLPPLYKTENESNPICHIKFFTPDSNWTWYVMEFDGTDTFFGYVCGLDSELGYFSLSELENYTSTIGLKIERDLSFAPITLDEVKKLQHD